MNHIQLYSSSQLLHRQWFQKLGDPYDNEVSRKNINHPGFRAAWEELMILTKFIDQNRSASLEVIDEPSTSAIMPLKSVAKPRKMKAAAARPTAVASDPSTAVPEFAETSSILTDANPRTVIDIEMQLKKCSVATQSISNGPKSIFLVNRQRQIFVKDCRVLTFHICR